MGFRAMTTSDALIVFVKNPVVGKVKTRLAATMGDQRALDIYLELLEKTRCTLSSLSCTLYIYYSDFVDDADDWTTPPFLKRLQQGSDLGARMHHALRECLLSHPKAVLVGSDIPELQEIHIQEAFLALDNCDYVLGPAMDGGYYLVGMKSPETTIFQDISWSTPMVLEQTLQHIRTAGQQVQLLSVLSDIDTAADWEKLQQ